MQMHKRTLGEICDEVGGVIRTGPFGSQLHQSDYRDEGIPVVMPKDIVGEKLSEESIARIGAEDVARLSQHILREGDIVYGRRGDIGRQSLITKREAGWLCGTGCLRIGLGDTVLEPNFLHYYLMQEDVIEWIYKQAIGATMPNLNTSILRSVPVEYPPLKTQRKIASILSAYDDLIENNTRRIKILEEMARMIYREWFVNFRFPGHEKVKMVDSPLGMIPEGWEVRAVDDVAVVHRGRSYKSQELVEDGGLPFLNLKCIDRDGGFRYDGIKRYQGQFKHSQVATTGEIIMAVTDMTQERRLVARAARVPDIGEDNAVISMDLVKISPKSEINPGYLYGMFRFSSFPDEIKQYANGANVLHLKPDHIGGFIFPQPPKALQNQYGEIVESVYRQCDNLNKKNLNLRQTRDLLLPKLISGEVSVL